jgi:hypothetical protein
MVDDLEGGAPIREVGTSGRYHPSIDNAGLCSFGSERIIEKQALSAGFSSFESKYNN